MGSGLSVEQILAKLEAQMAFHKEREEQHAQQEVFHREQRAVHAAEYANLAKHHEAFKASAGGAVELAARATAALSEEPSPAPVTPSTTSKLVARLITDLPAGATFNADQVTAEVNRRYPSELRRPAVPASVSTILRRLLDDGGLSLVKKGTAHRQAVYRRA